MKAVVFWCVVCCTAALEAGAQQHTVPISGNSRSIYFSPNTHFDQTLGTVFTYLTTSDGRTDIPPLGYPNFAFSGEARPRPIDQLYEADYMIYSQVLGWREYGSITLDLPTVDLDGNGLPDIAQLNRAVNITRQGNFYIDWPFNGIDSLTISMSRASNQVSGTYSLFRNGDASTSSGTIQLFNIAGSVAYTRSASLMIFSITINDPVGPTRTVTGSANYTVPNPNQIVLPQFSVTTNGGPTYTFLSGFTLNRTGTRYFGNAVLSDAIPETSWFEATNWVIEITDTNDWDSNGIPDLSDAIPNFPNIVSQPQSQTVAVNQNAFFSVMANGSMPLSYQWQFKGTNMAGRTLSTLGLTNVQLASAGDYRVIVSNGGGAATSQVATLTVVFPPDITDQPMDQTVIIGQGAQFNVGAIGTEPLYYQWRREGTNVPGAIDPILSFPNAQPAQAGAYSVVVSNAAGSITSSVARLTVLIPPTITSDPQSLSVSAGANAGFSVSADGSAPFSYRWMRNGTNVPNGTGPNLTLLNVQPASEGVFNVRVSNGGGNVLSSNATLYVGRPLTLTNFARDPGGVVRVDLIGLPTTNYILQSSLNLSLSNWISLATNSAARGILHFSDPTSTPPRFYRAKVKSP